MNSLNNVDKPVSGTLRANPRGRIPRERCLTLIYRSILIPPYRKRHLKKGLGVEIGSKRVMNDPILN